MAVRDSAQDAGGRPWRRQFASWHRAGNALIGFGGYDGRRIGSVVVVDDDGSEAVVHEGCGADPDAVVPPPLLHHRATVRGRTLVVLGGRTWPGAPFHGLHVLDLDTWRWRSSPDPNDDDDDGPAPRYRFALAHDPLGDRLFMQGGIGAGACLVDDSLWELDLGADPAGRRWRRLPDADRDDNRARRRPGRRHSHTMTFVDGRLYVLGGLTRPGAARPTDARLYCYDLGRTCWTATDVAPGPSPPPLYGHVAVVVGDEIVVVGGVSTGADTVAHLFLLRTRSMTWVQGAADLCHSLGRDRLLIGHGVVVGPGPGRLTLIGGGATCFSFGRWTNGAPIVIDLSAVFAPSPSSLI